MALPRVLILRDPSTEEGTPGVLVSESFGCHTLELPWLDNARKRSCIPAGVYRCAVVNSPRFGRVYGVQNVPGRTHILIHAGNWAGQIPQRKTHVQGCILLGERMGSLSGQRAVLLSRPAVRRFMAAMQGRPFELEVKWNP
jgi:hypothetical protein